ncbi:nitroreductase/quinone reductase family protein [Streptomyces sp. NPDC048419]|uniref:nitroreductase/quinone reductase family protein n=1 Tax=Streptomyces sp. NPDC048419 TaxID=3365547 RepID=UPI003719C214
MPNAFNQKIIDEFRANKGRLTGYFAQARLLLLTTTGARTGTRHTTPVGYLPDGGDRVLIIASAGGSPRHPDWYRNLLADPQVTVESGSFTYEARAVVLAGEERERAWARAVETDPGWAAYQEKTTRLIPVVALSAIAQSGPPTVNASSLGEGMKVVHDAFRRELALIREEMRNGNGRTLGAQLRVNCLTFCQGLHNHHTGEDTMLFPFIATNHPSAALTLERLRKEHEQIAGLVKELRRVVSLDGVGTGGDAAAARAEVERLTLDLEAHLTYEEEELLPLLDSSAA